MAACRKRRRRTPHPGARRRAAGKPASSHPALPAAGSGRGGYYQDDGPGDQPPPDLDQVPDAEPKLEAYSRSGNKPYVVFGKTYTPITDNRPFVQRGTGSWYGKKFHGQRTSSGERYDMYKMSAAHPTLPIPSYARVTNLSNGRQVIVRINDRGPFHSSRIIDLSYYRRAETRLSGLGQHPAAGRAPAAGRDRAAGAEQGQAGRVVAGDCGGGGGGADRVRGAGAGNGCHVGGARQRRAPGAS
ncbi:septal ring lytic transglycosylase RlpA family protein [Undibacterium arcticum]